MAIDGYDKAQITARAGLLRAGTGRADCVGDAEEIHLVDGDSHVAGEFKYTDEDEPPEDFITTYTRVAR